MWVHPIKKAWSHRTDLTGLPELDHCVFSRGVLSLHVRVMKAAVWL